MLSPHFILLFFLRQIQFGIKVARVSECPLLAVQPWANQKSLQSLDFFMITIIASL